MLIDGDVNHSHIMYLDSKPQRVDIDGKPHVFRFVDNFRTLLINGHPFKAEFGRNPMVVHVNQIKHYLRLTSLPRGVQVGKPLPTRDEIFAEADLGSEVGGEAPMDLDEDSQDQSKGTNLDRFMNNLMSSPAVTKPEKDYEGKNEAEKSAKDQPSAEGQKSEQPSTPSVDVQKLWASLLGAGLVSKNAENAIPGLETGLTPQATGPTKKVPEEEKQVEAEKELEPNSTVIPKTEGPVKKKINWNEHSIIKKINPVKLESRHETIKT